MNELVQPNWHPVLVHFPIALLTVGTFLDIFSFAGWRRSGMRAGARWMILLGAILAVPAALAGLYALADVLPRGIAAMDERSRVAADHVRYHVYLQSAATTLAMLTVVLWIAFSDLWRVRLNVLFKLALLTVVGLIVAGSWHGAEMVYAYDIGTHTGPASLPSKLPAADGRSIEDYLATLFPLEQGHVVMAGFALALACVALGFSARTIAISYVLSTEDDAEAAQRIAMAFSQDVGSIGEPRQIAAAEAVAARSTAYMPPVRAWPLWLLVSVMLLVTVGGGLWIIAHDLGTWDTDALRTAITKPVNDGDPATTRRLVHAIGGVTIIACSLLLTIAAVAAPRNRLLLVLLAVPLLLAMATQVWVGAIMVLDGPAGRPLEMSRPL